MIQTDEFIERLFEYIQDCKEYDILPHVTDEFDDIIHHLLKRSDTALAICSCTLPIFYCEIIQKPLKLLGNGDLLFLVLVNPNTATFWNCRRRALLKGDMCPKRELHYTKLILGTHPRSNEPLYHRLWIMKTFYSTDHDVIMNEFSFSDHLAHNYRAHYAVWQYRRFLIQLLESEHMMRDLSATETWLKCHPTDSSGWSYVDFLLQRLQKVNHLDRVKAQSLLHTYLGIVTETLELYPERECLWMFKRNILVQLWRLDHSMVLRPPITDETDATNRILGCLIALFTSRRYNTRSFHSVTAFLNFCYSNGLCTHPSDLQWQDVLRWRHLFFLLRQTVDTDIRSSSP